ncbi:MAG: nucleotide-binding protein [Eubacterium sp.]|nr:nucleotide-binding protein [Eubacterium sp.]
MTDYEKLKGIVEEIDVLINKKVSSSDSDFKAWKTKAERFLVNKFGQDSFEHNQFKHTSFSLMLVTSDTPDWKFEDACENGLQTTKAVFVTYLEEMEEDITSSTEQNQTTPTFEKLFIVHGHDEGLKQSVARIIEKQGIEAIILSEKTNQGCAIIEKFENYSDVNGAICLFTSDDIGRAKKDTEDKLRARQNVVLETGYFMGKLGRNRIVILADDGIEMPSDLSGVVYTNTSNWQIDLLKELKSIGYAVDFNKLF